MTNNTDYTKPHADVYDLLPQVFQSDTNKALSENVFNRFLSKAELVNVVGNLTNNPSDPLRIQEIDVQRQNSQLQPLLYSKIATVDHISSFKDLVNELLRLGVDYNRLNEWLSTEQFNLCPPVDMDKIVNYLNYYWMDQSEPQYITIKNRLSQLNIIIEQAFDDIPTLQSLIDLYVAETNPVQKQIYADQIELVYPGFVMLYEEYLYNLANITNTQGWDGIVNGLKIVNIVGNSFVVNGFFTDIINLLTTIRINDGPNAGTYTLSLPTSYDVLTNTTTIPVVEPIVNISNFTGLIDVGTYDYPLDGFQIISVDVNSFTIQENYVSIFNSLTSFNVVGGANAGNYTIVSSIFDQLTNSTIINVVQNLVDPITPSGLIAVGHYDYLQTNNIVVPNPFGFQLQNDQWSSTNRWVHISDVPSDINLGLIQQAVQPIIEYESFIELNEWSSTTYNWKYSTNGVTSYNDTANQPTDDEVLADFYSVDLLVVNNTTSFDVVVTDINPKLLVGTDITIVYDSGAAFSYHKIQNIVYDLLNNKATIEVDSVINAIFTTAIIQPIRFTSVGNDWRGFMSHWMYVSANNPVPCDNQVTSPVYDPNSLVFDAYKSQTISGAGSYAHWYAIDNITILNTDDVRVYINNQRVYGSYALGYYNGNFTTDPTLGDINGNTVNPSITFQFSDTSRNAIWFYDPVLSGSIRIETGPAADIENDQLKRLVTVKTSPTDTGTFVSLVQYRKVEQSKTQVQQYPLFNMYNLDGTTANKASPLWKFLESLDYPVNSVIHKRIVVDGDVYTFEQSTLQQDNGRIYGYLQNNELQTVWRTDDINKMYVPKYIDTNYDEVTIGDPSGDWELPKQMTGNIQHENRKNITTTELLKHFTTIIESQPNPPGYTGPIQNRWKLLDKPAYGAGGTIKEYNEGFDTFLSSLYVDGVNTIQLIDFAKREYDNSIRRIRTLLVDHVIELITTTDIQQLHDLQSYINSYIIELYQQDDFLEKVYGDSTCYDVVTNKGIRNWIATLPKFGLIAPVQPKLVIDDHLKLTELTHHDGHTSQPVFETVIINSLTKQLKNDSNTQQGLLIDRPDVQDSVFAMVYYSTDTNQFFKCIVSSYGTVTPTQLPLGSFWYDTSISQLKQNVLGVYQIVDRELCWSEIDFNSSYSQLLVQVEKNLYDVCQSQSIVYDINAVKSDIQYNENEIKQFAQFTAEYQISNPMASSYVATNAFSWNYSAVNPLDYRVITQPVSWATQPPSTWYNIYEQVFGTRNPQVEPWVLQKYNSKPTWWDSEYNTNPNRRWTMQMWINILDGIVPSGQLYANGNVSTGVYEPLVSTISQYETVPVNITDNATTDNLYLPDDLLPPYYNSVNPLDINVISYGVMLLTLPNQVSAALPFVYGQNGFTEDTWRRSIEFNYAVARISFITQPMRFMYNTFGNQLQLVNDLQVDISTNNIPSHKDTVFHGDMIGDVVYSINGINQWYVNFLRFNSMDINLSDFRQLWISWNPVLSYQMSSFADPRSVSLRNDTSPYDVSDYALRTKKTPGFKDYFLDSLLASVNSVGMSTYSNGVRIPLNKGVDWSFILNTANPKHIPLTLYGVDTSQPGVSFNILNKQATSDVWYHYPINKNVKYTFIPGMVVDSLGADYTGIQGVVNLIDGYVAYLTDCGFVFTDSTYNDIDPEWGRVNDWQFQIESFIQQIYSGMSTDQLPINFAGKWGYATVDVTNNLLTSSITNVFSFTNGEQIQFHSTGTLPQPITSHTMYKVANVDTLNRTFQITPLDSNTPIVLTSTGIGTLSFGTYMVESSTTKSFYEINPFTNTIVYDNTLGIISNVHDGSFKDIISEQGLYDQYGRPIDNKNIRVYRGDKRSFLRMFDGVTNDVTSVGNLHIGGIHLFLDGYEHAIMFNNTSIDGALLFDSFLGLQINKVKIDIRTNYTKTLRPNIGGRFLSQDTQVPNIEGMVGEIQYMYDTNMADEDSNLTKAARSLLGFETRDYFNEIGITDKSQFLFYRGMIQQKGSFNAITSFINLKSFVDAKVDEYWAYKVGEFGDARQKQFPQLNLLATDTGTNQLLLRFKTDKDNDFVNDITDITLNDQSRWNNQPQQMRQIFKDVENMYFESQVVDSVTLSGVELVTDQYIRLPVKCDGVVITTQFEPTTYIFNASVDGAFTFTLPNAIVPNASCLKIYISRGGEVGNLVPTNETVEDDNGFDITVNRYIDDVGQVSDLHAGDVVKVIVGNGTLVEDIHYTRINNQLIYLNPLQRSIEVSNQVSIFCLNAAKQKLNPIKLIDKTTDTNLQNIIVWDPAKNYHYHNADLIIDYKSDDPAYYTDSPILSDIDSNLAWLDRNVGQVWLDTTHVSYKPYFDTKIVKTWNQRLELWGQLEDWSSNVMYEWVKSTVHPVDYVSYVATQQKAGESISGVPRSCVFKRTRDIGSQLFEPNTWIEVKDFIKKDILINDPIDGGYLHTVDLTYVNVGALFNVYENGKLIGSGTVPSNGIINLISFSFVTDSFITIVVPAYEPTSKELLFNPDVKDDITKDTQYKVDYKFVADQRISSNLVDVDTTYYFWVRHTATDHNGLSLQLAEQQLTKIPQPYVTFDNLLLQDVYTTTNSTQVIVPSRYTRCAIRGLINKATSDDRFLLQFTRNFTMRDGAINDDGGLLNDKHSQWKMFRERQQFNIDKYLWDKLTEACSGVSLTNSSVVVPSLDYVLYDQVNNSNNRFGLRQGQTFCDSQRAIQIIIDEINNPNYDLYPIDREQFFEHYNFNTVEDIQLSLKTIYETFLPQDVNRIWFAVLFETLASNNRFTDIFKTSWIQLDGVRLLDTTGDLR